MTKELPFDEDVLTLIMGVEPETPGMHGRVNTPMPTKDAVSIITQIKDLCEEFLTKCGEDESEEEKPEKPKDNEKSFDEEEAE